MNFALRRVLLLLPVFILAACGDDKPAEIDKPPQPSAGIYGFAGGCYSLGALTPGEDASPRFLAASESGERFAFDAESDAEAARFFMKASDLGTYLFYDAGERYLVVEEPGESLEYGRVDTFLSDIFTLDDDYLPGAQWALEDAPDEPERYLIRQIKSDKYIGIDGLVDLEAAATITFYPTEDCAEFPELTLDAEGTPRAEPFEDGSVFGFVETHSHILSNFGFGGAGIFHGSAFHPFGVEHALPSCEMFHGAEGRQDLFGFGFDQGDDVDTDDLLPALVNGRTHEFNHHTDGYPTFTDWPSAHDSSTHQTQYYKWIERAYLSGLRLMVQHATTNSIICELLAGDDVQPTRYACNDMVAVDRIIKETRRMERYIDAQEGGPGEGWFRVVTSPAEAREVISEGKLAVVLGIETSNLFDCSLTPRDGEERCSEQDVIAALDRYQELGVRAIFPVHKYDNGFSAGDGHRGIIELGNFIQTGHWSNYTQDCPDVPARFDHGPLSFGGINQPRDDYFAAPPNDMSGFSEEPLKTLFGFLPELTAGPADGDYCQNYGLTPLGEFLMDELMKRGMIIEIDHMPRRAYQRAFELLEEKDYPASGSHGGNMRGELYGLGGVSKFNFGACSDPDRPGSRLNDLNQRLSLMEEQGAFMAEGFGFDLNGFAGAPGPRFGPKSVCGSGQENPISYPFKSWDGQITFTQPQVGQRAIDFNEEGLAHIGLVAELIEDVRQDGIDPAELEPLFKSAEGYLRMWERSVERGEALAK